MFIIIILNVSSGILQEFYVVYIWSYMERNVKNYFYLEY